jgi:hypothetical protein
MLFFLSSGLGDVLTGGTVGFPLVVGAEPPGVGPGSVLAGGVDCFGGVGLGLTMVGLGGATGVVVGDAGSVVPFFFVSKFGDVLTGAGPMVVDLGGETGAPAGDAGSVGLFFLVSGLGDPLTGGTTGLPAVGAPPAGEVPAAGFLAGAGACVAAPPWFPNLVKSMGFVPGGLSPYL